MFVSLGGVHFVPSACKHPITSLIRRSTFSTVGMQTSHNNEHVFCACSQESPVADRHGRADSELSGVLDILDKAAGSASGATYGPRHSEVAID